MPDMEKYGVEETVEDVKTAEAGARKCPSCGGVLRSVAVTGVLLCKKCGSKPFESEGPPINANPKTR